MAKLNLFGRGKSQAGKSVQPGGQNAELPPDPDDEDEDQAAAENDEAEEEAAAADEDEETEGGDEDEEAEGEEEEEQASAAQTSLSKAIGKNADFARVARLARAAERARIAAILGCKEAAQRPAAAKGFALKSPMAVGAARETLAGMPPEAAGGGRLATAMRNEPPPRVAPGSKVATQDRTAGLRAAIEQQTKR